MARLFLASIAQAVLGPVDNLFIKIRARGNNNGVVGPIQYGIGEGIANLYDKKISNNQIEYPERQIEQLMNEGKVDYAQKLYFEYETKRREGIIRL